MGPPVVGVVTVAPAEVSVAREGVEVVDDHGGRGVAVACALLGRSRDDQEVPDGRERDLLERQPQMGLLPGQLLQQGQRLVEIVGPEACVGLEDGHDGAPVVSRGYGETVGRRGADGEERTFR
ncbi:hypothetical protein AN221_15445 [Streptomyces nanshensis]|uniref:Uncharacterized protein n=1 Tax=Streptomyces nanshensis TaxID=518642 RepID=A0A1E7LU98_9ACTN|nr:hypothetical protein AN221_15445 [Streptomyces nanshensis]